jgi:hypothetical protein
VKSTEEISANVLGIEESLSYQTKKFHVIKLYLSGCGDQKFRYGLKKKSNKADPQFLEAV